MPSRVSPCCTTCVRGVGEGPGVGCTSSSGSSSVADTVGASDRSVAVGGAASCTGAGAQAVASTARDQGKQLTGGRRTLRRVSQPHGGTRVGVVPPQPL